MHMPSIFKVIPKTAHFSETIKSHWHTCTNIPTIYIFVRSNLSNCNAHLLLCDKIWLIPRFKVTALK